MPQSFELYFLLLGYLFTTAAGQCRRCTCNACLQKCTTVSRTTPCLSTTSSSTTTQNPPNATCSCSITGRTEDSSPGIIVGAALGGALFGFVTSLIIFVIFYRTSSLSGSRKYTATPSESLRNSAYQYEDNASPGSSYVKDSSQTGTAYSEINDGMLKTAKIAPIQKYMEPAIKDDVYNHLNESDKADRNEYYDHAGPALAMSVTEDGYGVVSMKSESKGESNGDYNTVDRKNNAGNKQNDNYFTLEIQED
ncbi:uncharacterized protein LOC144617712 isoform X2 [Crassostrea virginica]